MKNLIVVRSTTLDKPTIYNHPPYEETNNSSDIYKGSVIQI